LSSGRGGAFEATVKVLLETGSLDVETEDFGRERMLGGQVFGAPDTLLPASVSHRAIMGLRAEQGNCSGLGRVTVAYSLPGID
jgi:hypothetical protein